MLIRSQNREVLINLNSMAGIEIAEGPIKTIITSYITGCSYLLGEYSDKEKAFKVLDMIQEAYADAELNEILLPDVCKAANKSQQEKENTSIAKDIRNAFMKKMVFQMPDDEKRGGMSHIKDRLKQYSDKYSDCYKYAGVYVKVMPQPLRIFEYHEVGTQMPPKQPVQNMDSKYVTRQEYDDLKGKYEAIINRLNSFSEPVRASTAQESAVKGGNADE